MLPAAIVSMSAIPTPALSRPDGRKRQQKGDIGEDGDGSMVRSVDEGGMILSLGFRV